MKRAVLIGMALVVVAGSAFAAGYWYRHTHPTMRAEMEDYAVVNVLSQIGYVHYLKKGDVEGLRNLIDIELNSHLARVVQYQGAITDKEFLASKTRALNAAANMWDERSPFTSLAAESSKQPWWEGWQEMTKRNQELLRWAKEQCAANASLKCRSPNNTVEGDARKSGARPSP